jgi:hypothetical protein
MPNTAHVYKSKSGNWNLSFHHPICRDGSIGKKVHRSLKVTEEAEARRLQGQMDELLAIADVPARVPGRSHAVAEQKYADVIINAFYDCMAPEPIDYLALRERVMRLPPREGNRSSAPHILIVGPTAAGKSRLLQHFLQTTRENFPMRGAGRTTVADTEIIIDDVDFGAAVTFYAESEVREIIRENILEACAFAYKNKDRTKIASKLLVDSDKRFRLNFVLGNWSERQDSAEDDEIDSEDSVEEPDLADETDPSTRTWTKLEACIAQVTAMADRALETARRELKPQSDDDEAVVDEYWLQYVDRDHLDALTEEILEELERRLCVATGNKSWPTVHRLQDTADKAEFFRQLRPFYQNNRKLFGSLVTPLVQGLRACGRFYAPSWMEPKLQSLVLIDGQGVGHEQGSATKINRIVSPELTKKFSSADVICLVDRAVPAMTGDAPILLENLIVRGHQDRLAIVFTHFENVSGPDLDMDGRKDKVMEGLSSAIQAIDSLPKAQRVLLERTAMQKSYFLAKLDKNEIGLKSTRTEMNRLFEQFKLSAAEQELPEFQPLYNEYAFADVLSREIQAYRRDWSATELARFQWKIMQALTNWIGNAHRDGYPKQNLYPGQDLSQRLVGAVSSELEAPTDWKPYKPDQEEESRILNAIRVALGDKIDIYCRDILIRDPRRAFWLPAYEDIYGAGTQVRRARAIARILEDRAQLPDEGLGQFTKDIWQIIESTIAEVCARKVSEPVASQDKVKSIA